MIGFIPTHYLAEMGDWVAVCGADDGNQTWAADQVTCEACKAELA